jgi:hypothetical protein
MLKRLIKRFIPNQTDKHIKNLEDEVKKLNSIILYKNDLLYGLKREMSKKKKDKSFRNSSGTH